MRNKRRFGLVNTLLGTVMVMMTTAALTSSAAGQSPRDLIIEGNARYDAGEFEEAIEWFDRAIDREAAALRALFNKACATYRLGEMDDAIALFREVEASRDCPPELASAARYNVGRIRFDQGVAQAADDPEQAIATLEDAARAFREALDQDSRDGDAARNLEVTNRTINEIQRRLAEEEARRRQMEQMAEEARRLAERQNEAANQTRERSGQAEQEQQQQETESQQGESDRRSEQQQEPRPEPSPQQNDEPTEPSPEESERSSQSSPQPPPPPDQQGAAGAEESSLEDLRQEQQAIDEQTRQLKERLEQLNAGAEPKPEQSGETSPPPSTSDERLRRAEQSIDEAQREQRETQDALEQQDLERAEESQRNAGAHLREAAERLDPAQPGQTGNEQQQQQQPGAGQQDPGEMREPGAESGPQGAGEEEDESESPSPPPVEPQQPQQAGENGPQGEPLDPSERLVEWLLDRERERDEMRQAAERERLRRSLPVEKDW